MEEGVCFVMMMNEIKNWCGVVCNCVLANVGRAVCGDGVMFLEIDICSRAVWQMLAGVDLG